MRKLLHYLLIVSAVVTISFVATSHKGWAAENGAEAQSNAVTGFYTGKDDGNQQIPNPPDTGGVKPPTTGGHTNIPLSGAQPANETLMGTLLLAGSIYVFLKLEKRRETK